MRACRTLLAASVASISTLPATAQNSPDDLISVTYLCERGLAVPVTYVNPPAGDGYAVALIDGRLVAMRRAISASGARYVPGEYELWGKGETAMIFYGPESDRQMLLADCAIAK